MISAAGTTSSSRQPLVVPTSMYSMNRSTCPVCRKCAAIGRMDCSFTPRRTTMFTLTGASPAAAAAAMAASTRATGNRASLNMSSSSESRLTVTRRRPAAASAVALPASSAPLVVRAMSWTPSMAASIATSFSRSRRSSGSPPVSRSLRTPSPAKTRASRANSSKVSNCSRGKNTKSRPKISRGMQ